MEAFFTWPKILPAKSFDAGKKIKRIHQNLQPIIEVSTVFGPVQPIGIYVV